MIQTIMLVAMGFIAAGLLTLLMAPAFWSRAVRLTNQRLRSSLPVSEQEVRADKDLLRAEYALKVHQLEREVDQGRMAGHRTQIEINRRDIEIRRLADLLAVTDGHLNEHRNARNVLEQTVSTRIPQLEAALGETRRHLESRDAAFNELQATAANQAAALEDGRAIMAQRTLEVQRLKALFQESSAAAGSARIDTGSEVAIALRAENASLKTRLSERAMSVGRPPEPSNETAALPDQAVIAARLRELEEQLRTQTGEVARLRSEAAATAEAADPAANARIRESKIWLRARIDRIEAELERERETGRHLRAELAAGNERVARQAVQYRNDLRRFGNRQATPARNVLQTQNGASSPQADTSGPNKAEAQLVTDAAASAARRPTLTARAREMQRALLGHFGIEATADPVAGAAPAAEVAELTPATVATTETPQESAPESVPADASDPPQRATLLERIRGYEQA